jgi:hypothetical protein
MWIHVFFMFPETAQKPLEEVERIFDDGIPGSIRYVGTPAWRTGVDRRTRRLERGDVDSEEKIEGSGSHEEGVGEERLSKATKTG